MTPEFKAKVEEFIAIANQLQADYFERNKFTFALPTTHKIGSSGQDWVRIICVENHKDGTSRDGSVYAFIRVTDGGNKTLGAMKAGDVHKAASYKAPAKHARGNIFSSDIAKGMSEHGMAYLR